MKKILRVAIASIAVFTTVSAFSQQPGGWKALHPQNTGMKKKYGEDWGLRSIDLTKSILKGMDLTPAQRTQEQGIADRYDAKIDMVNQHKVREPGEKRPLEIKELAHNFRIDMLAILNPQQQKEFHRRWSAEMKANKKPRL